MSCQILSDVLSLKIKTFQINLGQAPSLKDEDQIQLFTFKTLTAARHLISAWPLMERCFDQ